MRSAPQGDAFFKKNEDEQKFGETGNLIELNNQIVSCCPDMKGKTSVSSSSSSSSTSTSIYSWEGKIFASYHQFYLWDKLSNPNSALDYDEKICKERVNCGPNIVVILTESDDWDAFVNLEIYDKSPESPDLDRWDHVTETSLHLPTGSFELFECCCRSMCEYNVTPGWYRVRALHANLQSVYGPPEQRSDKYQVQIWPIPKKLPKKILKQYTDSY